MDQLDSGGSLLDVSPDEVTRILAVGSSELIPARCNAQFRGQGKIEFCRWCLRARAKPQNAIPVCKQGPENGLRLLRPPRDTGYQRLAGACAFNKFCRRLQHWHTQVAKKIQ